MGKEKETKNIKHLRASSLSPSQDTDTIHVTVKKDLARKIGLERIREHLEAQVHLLYATQLKEQFDQALSESGIENNLELEKARQVAWNRYKGDFLKEDNEG